MAFFHFCKQREWVKTNPVMSVKLPQVDEKPTLPVTDQEFKAILAACDEFSTKGI